MAKGEEEGLRLSFFKPISSSNNIEKNGLDVHTIETNRGEFGPIDCFLTMGGDINKRRTKTPPRKGGDGIPMPQMSRAVLGGTGAACNLVPQMVVPARPSLQRFRFFYRPTIGGVEVQAFFETCDCSTNIIRP